MNEPLTDREKDALAALQKAFSELPDTLTVSVNCGSIMASKSSNQGYLPMPSKNLKVTFVALADPSNKKTQFRPRNPLALHVKNVPVEPSAIAVASRRCNLTQQQVAQLEAAESFSSALNVYLPELD